jgi:hypothetical protein
MTLPLDIEIVRGTYIFLQTTPPFKSWMLPDAEDVYFKVVKTKKLHGWYCYHEGKHTIAVSMGVVGHTYTLVKAVAHEMTHLYLQLCGVDAVKSQHGAAFKKLARKVCSFHGFDPREF